MQVAQIGDWTALFLALGIVFGLLGGQFLVHRLTKAWIRWRTGFGRETPVQPDPTDDTCTQGNP